MSGIDLIWIAQKLLKDEPLLFFSKDKYLIGIAALLVVLHMADSVCSLFVDPIEEDGLVGLEIGLLHKEGPQALYVFDAH